MELTKKEKLDKIREYCIYHRCSEDCSIGLDGKAHALCRRTLFKDYDEWTDADVDYIFSIAIEAETPHIADSGNRREFSTGAVRDMPDGKGEEWRDCVSYEGLYQVSNLGRVRSLYPKTKIKDKNGIMRQKVDGKGYRRVNLTKNGTQKAKLVSRLVAEAFIENPNGLPQVGHMDDNKLNNNCLNLYWTDAYENNMHNGKHDRLMALHAEKIDIIAQKLAKPVEAIDEDNGKIVRFASARAAARAMGASSAKISLCCNAKRNKHLGLKWRFVENANIR